MLYLVVGKNGHPYGGLLGTESEAQAVASHVGGGYVPLIEPWEYAETQVRGQGKSPFGCQKGDLTTMRVPRSIVHIVRKYAIWLSTIC